MITDIMTAYKRDKLHWVDSMLNVPILLTLTLLCVGFRVEGNIPIQSQNFEDGSGNVGIIHGCTLNDDEHSNGIQEGFQNWCYSLYEGGRSTNTKINTIEIARLSIEMSTPPSIVINRNVHDRRQQRMALVFGEKILDSGVRVIFCKDKYCHQRKDRVLFKNERDVQTKEWSRLVGMGLSANFGKNGLLQLSFFERVVVKNGRVRREKSYEELILNYIQCMDVGCRKFQRHRLTQWTDKETLTMTNGDYPLITKIFNRIPIEMDDLFVMASNPKDCELVIYNMLPPILKKQDEDWPVIWSHRDELVPTDIRVLERETDFVLALTFEKERALEIVQCVKFLATCKGTVHQLYPSSGNGRNTSIMIDKEDHLLIVQGVSEWSGRDIDPIYFMVRFFNCVDPICTQVGFESQKLDMWVTDELSLQSNEFVPHVTISSSEDEIIVGYDTPNGEILLAIAEDSNFYLPRTYSLTVINNNSAGKGKNHSKRWLRPLFVFPVLTLSACVTGLVCFMVWLKKQSRLPRYELVIDQGHIVLERYQDPHGMDNETNYFCEEE